MKTIDDKVTRCPKMIYAGSFFTGHLCQNKVWKDGWCRVHHPESVAKRHEKYENWRRLEKVNDKLKVAVAALMTIASRHYESCAADRGHRCTCVNAIASKAIKEVEGK